MNDKTTLASRSSAMSEAMRQRQQQQAAAKNTRDWATWFDQRIAQQFDQKLEGLHQALGQILAEERTRLREEIKEAVAEAKNAVETRMTRKLEVLEQRVEWLSQRFEQCSERIDDLAQAIETEREQRHAEIELAFDAAPHGLDSKLEATFGGVCSARKIVWCRRNCRSHGPIARTPWSTRAKSSPIVAAHFRRCAIPPAAATRRLGVLGQSRPRWR